MGKVYRVEDSKVKEEIALKLIKPEIAADKKTIERFRNELKIARKIRHKNVCAMFDLSEEEGSHFITMEYVPEEASTSSLSLEVLKKARLSPENMADWEMQNAMPIQIKVPYKI